LGSSKGVSHSIGNVLSTITKSRLRNRRVQLRSVRLGVDIPFAEAD